MKPAPKQPEVNAPDEANEADDSLLPSWAKAALMVFALLVMLGYTSPDMRAVYVAAWAACF